MSKRISSFSIILAFTCLSLVGLALAPLLTIKLSPDRALPHIGVGFQMAGSAPRVVETEMTSKLEAMLSRIKGIKNIKSSSGVNGGYISIDFDKHVNIDAARFEVSTVIRQTWSHLPKTTSYPTVHVSRSDDNASRPFMSYTVNASATPVVIRQFAENIIKPKLAQIVGVNRVDVTGAMPMEWRLEYDSKQLETLELTIQDVQGAIASYLNREFLGTASVENEAGNTQWIRVALMEKNDAANFNPADIRVKNVQGKLISLAQLVTVIHVEQEAQSYYRINGLNSIYLSITADETANQLNVGSEVKKTLENLALVFPAGYEIHLSYDATEYIRDELSKIYFRSGLTLIILLVFVLLIYRKLKYLLMIAISLTMNIAVAVIFYFWGGLEMQLYSLAGITISLTLIIDNTIVMSDQIIRRNNKKAFLAILTATITTVASLIIIFFMDERIRLNLQDFAMVIIINLIISLAIALFLVPALLEKLKIGQYHKTYRKKRYRIIMFTHRRYASFCRFTWRWRVWACLLIIFIFGLPVFLLPDKLESNDKLSEVYNSTLGSSFYKEKLKPYVDVCMGGTLRLFVEKVFQGSYFTDRQRTSIYITATLPNGSTITQMNNLIQRMESYISKFPEVQQFQTNIDNARHAGISIQFTKESEHTGFPYLLKSKIIGKSLELGGGSWGVYGVGDGFNNDVRENAGSYRVVLYGFNYDELIELAEKFKIQLLEHRRIKDVVINSEFSWYKDDYQEFSFDLNYERLAQSGIQPYQLFASLHTVFGREIEAGQLPSEYGLERVVLHSLQSQEYDVWSLEHIPGVIAGGKEYKLNTLASIQKTQAPQNIVKENQQYKLCLQYDYVGAYEQGNKMLDNSIDEIKADLPMGYTVVKEGYNWNWGQDNKKQYVLLLLIFVIIYFMCSILFNSLRQPLSVIFVIPIAFIGIFLTFSWFKLNFDQGGFASFVLSCGLSVNANIYILNEYNNIRRRWTIAPLKAYIKAWSAKMSPVFLTIISTVLGFIPFMIGEKEAFWFPLAAGTIGGLTMSLVGTFLFLPLFMGVGKKLKPVGFPPRKNEKIIIK
ncbi:MAG: efflux RND transporter permease subunit [Prevotellaceae bacterium]|jgi:multidrug efflux pump subunit AcrB|nr:efflux RND transporter permease subunit [Prevotellaceae bacterium]